MDFGKFHFGRIEIDRVTYERDVVIDRGRIRKRKEKLSKRFREEFGHTPVSVKAPNGSSGQCLSFFAKVANFSAIRGCCARELRGGW
jgi:hypothetical protein